MVRWLPLLLFPCASMAQTQVDILGSVYSAEVNARWQEQVPSPTIPDTYSWSTLTTTQTVSQAYPASINFSVRGSALNFGAATAETFSVGTATSSWSDPANGIYPTPFIKAIATTELTFSPTSDGIAPLSFTFSGGGELYTFGSISLLDATTNQTQWVYSWDTSPFSTITDKVPWNFGRTGWSAFMDLGTMLYDSHDYVLKMVASTNANGDSEHVNVSMAGLSIASPAPEPETLVMWLVGLSIVGAAKFRRRPRH